MSTEWRQAQEWEANWWGTCANTFGEEAKQITYAHRMGLVNIGVAGGYWPLYDLAGKTILDFGGGPCSMLLKCVNSSIPTVVDPGNYPSWIGERYSAAGIAYFNEQAERFVPAFRYDECWIYNVLQHVVDPERIVRNACDSARLVRVFEWIDLPPYQGHLHELKEQDLNHWLGTKGTVETITENGIENGRAYYAVTQT